MLITWRKILPLLISLVFASAVLSTAAFASSESFWKDRETRCRGNLALMFEEVERTETIPYYRTNRSALELFKVLKKADRFQELGLTEKEGLALRGHGISQPG